MGKEQKEAEYKRLNLYLPKEDGEEIIRLARHAAIDTGVRFNTWVFRTLRKHLGMPEPKKHQALGKKKAA